MLTRLMSRKGTTVADEHPRKAWYQLGCKGCGKPTAHAALTDGLCPDCYAPIEAEADVPVEVTTEMINAGFQELRAYPGRDALTAEKVFRAMLKAMPLEQKRALLRDPKFGAE